MQKNIIGMKRNIILSAVASMLLTGCGFTRITTVTPITTTSYPNPYVATVTTHQGMTHTTVTPVRTNGVDISLHLDLQAVAAAFAQSSNVQEFEYLLNNSSYMLSNLDLNRDGYIDYLRVVETMEGYNHLFIIQAVLAMNVYQDVATIVAEVPNSYNYHVQVIGSPYVYGRSYIIEPVFVVRPVIFNYICRPYYKPWCSPWYWNHYPSCYRHPAPIHISHYNAYITTFMTNNRYCHEYRYADSCHYRDYDRVVRPIQRNDYGTQHPEHSFTVRNANTPNARGVRDAYNATTKTTTTEAPTNSRSGAKQTTVVTPSTGTKTTGATAGTATSSRTGSSSTTTNSRTGSTTSTSATSSRTGSSTSATSSRSGSTTGTTKSSTSTTTTTTTSRVRSSGSQTTTTRVSTPNSSTSTTRSGSTSSRSGSTSSSSATKSSTGSVTRSGASSTSTRSGATNSRRQ